MKIRNSISQLRDKLEKQEAQERLVKDYYPEEYDVFSYNIKAAKDLLNDCKVLLDKGEMSEVDIKFNKIMEITSKTLAEIIYNANLRKKEEEKKGRFNIFHRIIQSIRVKKF